MIARVYPEPAMTKDVIEQCRTLHLTLVAICFVLLIAWASEMTNSDLRTYREIKAVSSLVQAWENDWLSKSVATEVEQRFDKLVIGRLGTKQIFMREANGDSYYVINVEKTWYLSREKTNETSASAPASINIVDFYSDKFGRTKIATLNEFSRIWNLLGDYPVLNSLELVVGGYYVDKSGRHDLSENLDSKEDLRSRGIDPKPIAGPTSRAVLTSRSRAIQLIEEETRREHFWSSERKRMFAQVLEQLKNSRTECLFVPSKELGWIADLKNFYVLEADCVTSPVGFQKLFGVIAPVPPPTGTFDTAFPELDAATKWLRPLPFENLEKHLYDRQNRSGDKLEVLGAKIPANGIASWGMLAFIGVSMFFLLHFRVLAELSRQGKDKFDVAWIGIYSTWLPRSIFLGSVVVLPLVTAAALVWLGTTTAQTWAQVVAHIGGAVVSILIAVCTSVAAFRIWGVAWRHVPSIGGPQ